MSSSDSSSDDDQVIRGKPASASASAGDDDGSSSDSSSSSSSGSSSSGSSGSSSSSGSDSDSDDEEQKQQQPATDAREVNLDLESFNQYLTCQLCQGYYRDAYTSIDCLHTFCMVCLERHIAITRHRDIVDCPIKGCPTQMIAQFPMKSEVRFDRAIQNLVDKLIPTYAQQDDVLKKEIFVQYGGNKRSSSSSAVIADASTKKRKFDDVSHGSNERQMIFELRPSTITAASNTTPLAAMALPFVKTKANVSIRLLSKLILSRLSLPSPTSIDVQCSGEVLGQDHTIEYVFKTRWQHVHQGKHLVLTYRLTPPVIPQ